MKYGFATFLFYLMLLGGHSQVDPDWILNLKTTGQISSNHFADLAVDPQGNAYLASFFEDGSGKNRLYVVKISAEGKKIWEFGRNTEGRATCIAFDPSGQLWVGGYYMGTFELTGAGLVSSQNTKGFVVTLTGEGKCTGGIDLSTSIPYNIALNKMGTACIGGIFKGKTKVGSMELKSDFLAGSYFAGFDKNRTALWLNVLEAGEEINRIRPAAGGFVAVGVFNDYIRIERTFVQTEGNFDQDGFVLKINEAGRLIWLQTFGEKGVSQPGYRTHEGAFDVMELDGHLMVGARLEKSQINRQLAILKLDPGSGEIKSSTTLMQNLSSNQAFALSKSSTGWFTIAGSAKGAIQAPGQVVNMKDEQAFIAVYDGQYRQRGLFLPIHGNNTSFRSAQFVNKDLLLSGHFQSHFEFGSEMISNDGHHGLFMMRIRAAE